MHRLGGDEMVGQLDVGRAIFQARLAPGKNRGGEFLRAQALNPCRHLAPPRRAHHRQRARRDVAHAHLEHRRGQQRLLEHVAHRARGNHRHQRLERKAMARVEREQHRVVDRRGLDFEVERLAKAFADRQPQPAVDAHPERRVNHHLGAAEAVEEALDHQRALVGNRAERALAAAHVIDRLARRALVHRALAGKERGGRGFVAARDALEDFAAQFRDFGGERGRAARRLGLPERQRRRHPGRRLDQEAVARDSEHPPRHRAEREDVAARGLLGEVLFDVADLAPLRFDHDVEVAAFGNRAARGDRGQARAAPRAHARADTVVEDFRRRALDPRRQFGRHLIEQMNERGRGQARRSCRRRAAGAAGRPRRFRPLRRRSRRFAAPQRRGIRWESRPRRAGHGGSRAPRRHIRADRRA